MKSTCPVCLEVGGCVQHSVVRVLCANCDVIAGLQDLAVSVVSSQRMACGHMIHCKCLKQLLRTTYAVSPSRNPCLLL